jgi:hypothetical protein
MQSTRSSSWHSRSSSWRKAARAGTLAAGQNLQQQQDPSVLRIVARCDSFQAYFRGQYAPVEQQLAMLEASCGWSTLQPPSKLPSLQDTQHEQDSSSKAGQLQQQQVAENSLKSNSAGDAAVRVSVGA